MGNSAASDPALVYISGRIIGKFKRWINDKKKIKPYTGSNSYVAPYARFQYQIDILVMDEKYNPRYALIVIDIFSKLANAEPMEQRNQETVLK